MKATFGFAIAFLCAFALALSVTRAADDAKPKYTIKEVMKIAHKEGLMKKAASGTATDAEKKQLLELYQALAASTPPKGEEADFKQRANAMVVAVQAVIDGAPGAGEKLSTTVNCAECHKTHK